MIKKIRQTLGGSEAFRTIAVLGLTFKPGTDDMRDSPALSILPTLLEKGARIRATDPQGMADARPLLPEGIEYFDDAYDTARNADAVVLMTQWNAYRGLDMARLLETMRGRVFIDLRNVYEPQLMAQTGFESVCVGR